MPTVRFKGEYSHITFTSPDLKIFRPKINKAYFATAKIEEVTTTSTTQTVQETYVVAGGDTLSKIASKKGTTVNAIIESDNKLTEANKDKLKVGQKITLPSTIATTETNKKITFEKVNEGTLDSELYLVVETEGFQGYSLYFNIKQGKEKGIEEKDGLITFKDEDGNYKTKGEVKVGALCEKHYINVDDYAETAIYKLQIDHNNKTKKEAWQKALEGKDKKTPLYLLVEGHTVPGQEEININYHGDSEGGEIRGEAIKNLWLDSDGNWFELKRKIKWHNPVLNPQVRGRYAIWAPERSIHSNNIKGRAKGKHDGLDLYAPEGTPLYAVVSGEIYDPYISGSYGNTLTIKGFYNGIEYYFFYAHLKDKVTYKSKDKVEVGDIIGYSGKTGSSAKNLKANQVHLHFEVRTKGTRTGNRVNPLEKIAELKTDVELNPKEKDQL